LKQIILPEILDLLGTWWKST